MNSFFNRFFNFFMSTFFQIRVRRFSVFTLFRKMRVNIETWLKNWFHFDLITQCFNLCFRYFETKIKSMMNVDFFMCHVTVFCDKARFNFVFITIFSNWSTATCWVGRAKLLQIEWCKLKSFKNTCTTPIYNWFLIADNINELSIDAYKTDEKLYTL